MSIKRVTSFAAAVLIGAGLTLVSAPGSQAAPMSTPGYGKKCSSWEEGDIKYSRGDEWICLKVGKSWQRKFMWFIIE
jgi:hypothetical protein